MFVVLAKQTIVYLGCCINRLFHMSLQHGSQHAYQLT